MAVVIEDRLLLKVLAARTPGEITAALCDSGVFTTAAGTTGSDAPCSEARTRGRVLRRFASLTRPDGQLV
jgi:hypothetical protein